MAGRAELRRGSEGGVGGNSAVYVMMKLVSGVLITSETTRVPSEARELYVPALTRHHDRRVNALLLAQLAVHGSLA